MYRIYTCGIVELARNSSSPLEAFHFYGKKPSASLEEAFCFFGKKLSDSRKIFRSATEMRHKRISERRSKLQHQFKDAYTIEFARNKFPVV